MSTQSEAEARELIVDLCRQFYHLGWVTGTGGGIAIRAGGRVFMAPSGVQKERLTEDQVFILELDGRVACAPSDGDLRPSECAPLFFNAFRLREAGAVIHSHGMFAMLSGLAPVASGGAFECTHLEMIKGLAGHGYHDRVRVPIIDNTAHERDLADAMASAMVRTRPMRSPSHPNSRPPKAAPKRNAETSLLYTAPTSPSAGSI